jgi:hypothetical protein
MIVGGRNATGLLEVVFGDVQGVLTELLLIGRLVSVELIGFKLIGVGRVVIGLVGIHGMICSIE